MRLQLEHVPVLRRDLLLFRNHPESYVLLFKQLLRVGLLGLLFLFLLLLLQFLFGGLLLNPSQRLRPPPFVFDEDFLGDGPVRVLLAKANVSDVFLAEDGGFDSDCGEIDFDVDSLLYDKVEDIVEADSVIGVADDFDFFGFLRFEDGFLGQGLEDGCLALGESVEVSLYFSFVDDIDLANLIPEDVNGAEIDFAFANSDLRSLGVGLQNQRVGVGQSVALDVDFQFETDFLQLLCDESHLYLGPSIAFDFPTLLIHIIIRQHLRFLYLRQNIKSRLQIALVDYLDGLNRRIAQKHILKNNKLWRFDAHSRHFAFRSDWNRTHILSNALDVNHQCCIILFRVHRNKSYLYANRLIRRNQISTRLYIKFLLILIMSRIYLKLFKINKII